MKGLLTVSFLLLISQLLPHASIAQATEKTTTKSGLTYIRLLDGDGASPETGDKVKIWFIGRLSTGKVFEKVEKSVKFTVGDKQLIPGFSEALALMKEGERARFIMPPEIAYGEKGSTGLGGVVVVPPNETISFEILMQKVY